MSGALFDMLCHTTDSIRCFWGRPRTVPGGLAARGPCVRACPSLPGGSFRCSKRHAHVVVVVMLMSLIVRPALAATAAAAVMVLALGELEG